MIDLVTLAPHHFDEIGAGLQPGFEDYVADVAALNDEPNQAYALRFDGEAVAIGGIAHYYTTRWLAWAKISERATMRQIVCARAVARRVLGEWDEHRVECHIDPNFRGGLVFARSLGFVVEGLGRKITETGGDALVMARVF